MFNHNCKLLITQNGLKIGVLSIPFNELDENPKYQKLNVLGKPIPFDWLPNNMYVVFTTRITSHDDVILILE
jgi:hypothetical protein